MLGFTELQVAVFLILVVALIEAWRLRHAGHSLILKDFRVGPSDTTGEFLYILGQRAGILAGILGLFGLEAQTSFSATNNEVARETVGPSGFESRYAPLVEISASECSYYRAFWVLVLSLAFYAYGLLSLLIAAGRSDDSVRQSALGAASYTLWVCLIVGTALYIWYARSKRVLISVMAKGNVGLGISFKGSQEFELRKASEAVDLMNARILAKK